MLIDVIKLGGGVDTVTWVATHIYIYIFHKGRGTKSLHMEWVDPVDLRYRFD